MSSEENPVDCFNFFSSRVDDENHNGCSIARLASNLVRGMHLNRSLRTNNIQRSRSNSDSRLN